MNRRRLSLAKLFRHGKRALEEIAEIVAEFTVVAIDKPLCREVAVGAERNLTQKMKPHDIIAILLNQLNRINHVPKRLGHLLAVDREEAMRKNGFGKLIPSRHEHGGPVGAMKLDDVFADKMKVNRPAARIGRDIIDERVKPHVDRL